MAGTVGRVEDFVVEDTEIEGEAQTNGVSGGQFGLCNIRGILKVWELTR